MSVEHLNAGWAGALVDRLLAHGVRDLCLAPGSRSAPLALAVARRAEAGAEIRIHTHLDERGLAFFALGLIRRCGRPAAVVTTSGTAVPNLHPAVAEAQQSRLPLIAVTADRPPELHDCGANQAIPQEGLLRPQVRAEAMLPPPDGTLLGPWLAGRLDIALAAGLAGGREGPVHINVPFREPLYGDTEHVPATPAPPPPPPEARPAAASPAPPEAPLLFVAGALDPGEASALLACAEAANVPILADINSQLRLRDHPCVIPAAELLLATPQGRSACAGAGQVIQLGGRLTGKRLPAWLREYAPQRWLVSPADAYLDPDWQARAVRSDIPSFCSALQPRPQASLPGLAEATAAIEAQRRRAPEWPFAEPAALACLSRLLPAGMPLLVGNSLPVRAADLLAEPRHGNPVVTQRGASGIDGLIATAAGYATPGQEGITAVVGDLSALHDLNSLALLPEKEAPCILVVLNNDGGGIFDLLPAQGHSAHERLFRMPHGLRLEPAAAQFGLAYHACASAEELATAYREACQRGGRHLIEAICPPERGSGQMAALFRELEADT